MTWRLKACPRCGGDMYADSYFASQGIIAERVKSWVCLQCGHETTRAPPRKRHQRPQGSNPGVLGAVLVL